MSAVARKTFTQDIEPTLYRIGDVVQHAVFGYRGVIIRQDSHFIGNEEAYQNLTKLQPNKNQPWYHILVDGTDSMTYVAEIHLTLDTTNEPIDHPLTKVYFEDFEDGKYRRTLH